MLPQPDLRAERQGWLPRQQQVGLAVVLWVTVGDTSGARWQRGGPTIACPVTAARSEHPEIILHNNSKKGQPYSEPAIVRFGSKQTSRHIRRFFGARMSRPFAQVLRMRGVARAAPVPSIFGPCSSLAT